MPRFWLSIFLVASTYQCYCTSLRPVHQVPSNDETAITYSRRELLWKLPLGAVGTCGYGRLCYNAISVRDIRYPDAHERRVKSTTQSALLASTQSGASNLQILEVGVGKDFRLLRRGLYDGAFEDLSVHGIRHIDLVAVDPLRPSDSTLLDARQRDYPLPIDVTFIHGSIETRLDYPDGHFDAIICCLTLCSVDNVTLAIKEMNRLLRPNGGCLGYIEHVAVNNDEPYAFLDFQQRILDPVQQALADNCHLHRFTQQAITKELTAGQAAAVELTSERFIVNSMWPVSCQACGVIQKTNFSYN